MDKWSSGIQNRHFHLLLSCKQHPFDLKFRPWIEFDFHIYHTRRFFYLDDASVSRDEWDWMYCSCVWILNLGAILSVGGRLLIGKPGQKLQAFLPNEIRMVRIQSVKLSEGVAQHKYAFALMAYWWAKTDTTCFLKRWNQNGPDSTQKTFLGCSSAQIWILVDGILVSQERDQRLFKV